MWLTPTDDVLPLLVLAFAFGLALVHLVAGRLRGLDVIPRSQWLSVASGISVAYIFVHVLPELDAARGVVDESGGTLATVEHHVYLIVLGGFLAFYGIERFAREWTPRREGDDAEEPSGVFWTHIGSFAAYNALVGYLLVHRDEPGIVSLAAFAVAMGVHFLVNDHGLRAHHGQSYHRYGRWILAAAVLGGTAIGAATKVGAPVIALLLAFLAGAVILNVMKEELPAERRSRFWMFTIGAIGYAALLLAA